MAEQLFGRPHTDVSNEGIGRRAGEEFELREKRRAAYADFAAEPWDVELRVVEMLDDDVFRFAEYRLVEGADTGEVHFGNGLLLELFLEEHPVVQEAFYPRQEDTGVEGLGDIIVRALAEALHVLFGRIQGREQDDRDVAQLRVAFELGAKLRPAHFGHHDVAHDQVRHLAVCYRQRLFPVRSCQDRIELAEYIFEYQAHFGVIVDQQYRIGVFWHQGVAWFFFQLHVAERVVGNRVAYLFPIAPVDAFVVLIRLFGERKVDGKDAARPRNALDRDVSVMQLDDFLRQGQADARPRHLLRYVLVFALIKAVEDMRDVFRCDANAGITYRDLHHLVSSFDFHPDFLSVGRIFEGIGKQVGKDLAQLLVVEPPEDVFRYRIEAIRDAAMLGVIGKGGEDVVYEKTNVQLRQLQLDLVLREFAEVQQVGHQARHDLGMLFDALKFAVQRIRKPVFQ